MAEAAPSILNKRATEKLRSPDDLDKYVRVTNPSVWVILLACLSLVFGLLMWGLFGTVSTSVGTTGTVRGGEAYCLLSPEDAAKVHEGDPVNLGGERGTVGAISKMPLSLDELKATVGSDYLLAAMLEGDWGYYVDLEGDWADLDEFVPYPLSITTERIAPIQLVFGGTN